MKTEHSDNTYLQCLLLEVGFQDMKKEMKRRHEEFRQEQVPHYIYRTVLRRFLKL